MRRKKLMVILSLGTLGLCSAWTASAQASETHSRPQLVLTLHPTMGADTKVAGIDVALELNGIDAKTGHFAFRIPVEFAGIKHVADRVENLEVRNTAGVLKLKQVDEPPDAGGSLFWRRWELPEPPPSRLNVRYHARLDPAYPWPGPPFDLRSNGGGVSGAGFGFLVLPDSKDKFDISLKWDLRDMPPGARAVSSVGDGDVHFEGAVDQLHECFYVAGPIETYPDNFASSVFRSAWLGKPPFDPRMEMKWSEGAYHALRDFFGETSTKPFYFFMRAGRDNESYGGAALANSFLLFANEAGSPGEDSPPRMVIAHEITHHFAVGLSSPDGIEGSWFTEGLAEYYSRFIMFRAGLIPPSTFQKAVNESAQAYYTNPLKELPNSKIAEAFWRDKRAQGLPYQRGFFYFVDTNEKLLAASKGKVSLDNVVLAILARRGRGEDVTPQTWEDAIDKELGTAGTHEFESVVLHGELVLPSSEAFGPCFERQKVEMGAFELGFDQHKSLDTQPRIIQGLESGSAAERAGLRNGDIVLAVDPVYVDKLRSDATKRISLRIKRGNDTLQLDYLPRSHPVEAYQWIRRAKVPDEACVLRN